jgi:hypothetical protein
MRYVVAICIWREDFLSFRVDLLGWQGAVSNWFLIQILESEGAYISNEADD